jgi:hypothetical protein
MTTYDKVLDALGDGDWHARRELEEVTVFPEEWLRELLREGYDVLEDEEGRVRLRVPEPAAT